MDETHENPLEVPGLQLIFEEGYNDYPDHCFTNFLIVGGSTENDPFTTLPFEILELIVAELTLEDHDPIWRPQGRAPAAHCQNDSLDCGYPSRKVCSLGYRLYL